MTSCLLISTVSKKFKRPSQVIRFSCQPRGMLRASQKKERLLTKEGARFDSIKPNSFKSTHPARGVPNTIGTQLIAPLLSCVPFLLSCPQGSVQPSLIFGFSDSPRWLLPYSCFTLFLLEVLNAESHRRLNSSLVSIRCNNA